MEELKGHGFTFHKTVEPKKSAPPDTEKPNTGNTGRVGSEDEGEAK
jgi:hypothetical protein